MCRVLNLRGPQAAKYRDPKSGATWSGRGPTPAWLAGAKDRSKFLIAGRSERDDRAAQLRALRSLRRTAYFMLVFVSQMYLTLKFADIVRIVYAVRRVSGEHQNDSGRRSSRVPAR